MHAVLAAGLDLIQALTGSIFWAVLSTRRPCLLYTAWTRPSWSRKYNNFWITGDMKSGKICLNRSAPFLKTVYFFESKRVCKNWNRVAWIIILPADCSHMTKSNSVCEQANMSKDLMCSHFCPQFSYWLWQLRKIDRLYLLFFCNNF